MHWRELLLQQPRVREHPRADSTNKDWQFFDGVELKGKQGEYPIPSDCTIVQLYMNHVSTMPQTDPPDVFGLHALADVKLRRDQANEIFQKIIDIQPKESAMGGVTREDIVKEKIKDMMNNVPDNFNMEYVRQKVADRKQQPLDICCKQEIERMQKVIITLRTTLVDLKLAIEGTIVMNDQLYDAMNSLYDARIPPHWLKISWPSDTLKEWFDQVHDRTVQYTKWIDTGKVDGGFWLGGMFNPAGFLTSFRQQTCRNTGWSLDQTYLMKKHPNKMTEKDESIFDDIRDAYTTLKEPNNRRVRYLRRELRACVRVENNRARPAYDSARRVHCRPAEAASQANRRNIKLDLYLLLQNEALHTTKQF